MMKLNPYLLCFTLIAIVAVVLRVCTNGLFHFTHDELSALSRTGYSSFSELMNVGVVNDLHPPLVQIFIHYWTSLFGTQEWVVKLPFILIGLITIYQTGWLTRKWFGDSAALLSVALLSVMEFHLYHNQTARPYVAGLFFYLLFCQAWSVILFSSSRWKDALLFSVAAAGAAYSHHCAGLAVGITGIAGIIYLRKSNALPYLLGGVAALILYLPNLFILTAQLHTLSEVGHTIWLAPPEPDFLYTFVAYALHFSWPFLITTLIAILYPLFRKKDQDYSFPVSLPYFLLLIFLIQFGLIYWYSMAVSAVLQYSSLFFVAPLAVSALFSGWKKVSPAFSLYLIIVLLLISGVYSLFITRAYNKVMDVQAFEAYHDVCQQTLTKFPKAKVSILLNTERYFQEVYMKRKNFTYSFHDNKKGFSIEELQQVIKEEQPEILILGNPQTGFVEWLMQSGYPHLIHYQEGSIHEIYVLSKQPNSSSSTLIYKVVSGPSDTTEVKHDSEWPATIRIPLDTLIENQYDRIIAGVWVKADTSCKALLYMNYKNEAGETVDFRGVELNKGIIKNGWNYVAIGIPLWALHLKGKTSLEVAIWNNNHETFSIHGLSVFSEKGNALQYAVIEPSSGKNWNW